MGQASAISGVLCGCSHIIQAQPALHLLHHIDKGREGLAVEGDKCSRYFRIRTKFLISKCPYLVESFRAEFLQSVIVHMVLSLKLTQKHVHKA